jgi:hypothetical protein
MDYDVTKINEVANVGQNAKSKGPQMKKIATSSNSSIAQTTTNVKEKTDIRNGLLFKL